MKPPLCFTMPYTVARPRPVPLPTPFVVKNGSKMRAFVSASMPRPVSRIVERHERARLDLGAVSRGLLGGDGRRSPSRSSACRRPGIASRALTTRFRITCSSCPGSAFTRASPEPYARDELDVLADEAAQHAVHVADDLVEVEDLRLQHLLAAEGEQLARERRARAARPCSISFDVVDADRSRARAAGRARGSRSRRSPSAGC